MTKDYGKIVVGALGGATFIYFLTLVAPTPPGCEPLSRHLDNAVTRKNLAVHEPLQGSRIGSRGVMRGFELSDGGTDFSSTDKHE
jgi:hypothetical protein